MFKKYVFSDETMVCNTALNKLMIRRRNGTAYDEQNLQRIKQPSAKCMLWLYICQAGKGEVFLAENDRIWNERGHKIKPPPPNQKNKGFDNLSYVNLIKKAIPSIRKVQGDEQDWQFVQDNSPVHTSKAHTDNTVFDLFEREGVSYVKDWPALSPDLHPVENAHKLLKDQMRLTLPRLTRQPNNKARLLSLAESCWKDVCNEKIKKIFNSFEDRLKLCILHGGNNNFSTITSSKANRATLARWNDQLLETSTELLLKQSA